MPSQQKIGKDQKKRLTQFFSLLVEYINSKIPFLIENDIKLIFSGRRWELSLDVIKAIEKGEKATENCKSLTVVITLNYSGRAEIVDAVNKMLKEGITQIDEDKFRDYLYNPDVPDPDLLIRTSGEERISNFLLWQIAYTELYFTPVLWPDFSEEDFLKALYVYQSRERRFGRVLDE